MYNNIYIVFKDLEIFRIFDTAKAAEYCMNTLNENLPKPIYWVDSERVYHVEP